MKRSRILKHALRLSVWSIILGLGLGAHAAEFYQKVSMGVGAHWNQAFWTNATETVAIIPSSGNTYVNGVGSTRTATGENFLGDLLTIRSGKMLIFKHSPGTVSVNLVMEDGSTIQNGGSSGQVEGTLTGNGSILLDTTTSSSRPITIGSLLTSDNTFSQIQITGINAVTLTNSANTFTGVWNVVGGTLKGAAGLGQPSGFNIGATAKLDLDAGFLNPNADLSVALGGTLILDQDVMFDHAVFGPYPLAAGTYTASELWNDPAYSNAIDSASDANSTLTVLSDPEEYQIAIFNFQATNGVSSDVYAYSDVADWDLTYAGTGASYTNGAYPAFNGTATVTADKVGTTANPIAGNYHSFSFTVEGMAPGTSLNLNNLDLDYTYLQPLGFRLQIYSSVTGQSPDTFTTGDTPIYDTGAISAGTFTDVNVALTNAVFQSLGNGNSIEFRFVLTDGSTSSARVHGIDNVILTGNVVSDPPPPAPVVWENDMSVDPISGAAPNWVVRGSSSNYTVSAGLLSMEEGAYSTLLDSNPLDAFEVFTKVDLVWKTTSDAVGPGAEPGAYPWGAGLWLNVNNDAPTYGSFHFGSVVSNGLQKVVLVAGNDTPVLAEHDGFSTNAFLTLHAEIDSEAKTVSYTITDGSLSVTNTESYVELSTAGSTSKATLYTYGPSAEFDYVRIEANARPAIGYLTSPALDITLLSPATLAAGTVSMVYGSATNLQITAITVSAESHAGSLSVLTTVPQTLTNASASIVRLTVAFDNSVANLEYGTATGLVTVAWTEQGSGVTNSTVVPVSAITTYPAGQNNDWTGAGDGVNWGDKNNWSLGRVPGAYAADKANILGGATVTVATNFTGAFSYDLNLQNASTLNVLANMTVKSLTILTNSLLDINGGMFTLDNAGVANSLTGTSNSLIKVRSGGFQTTANVATITDTYECGLEISGGTVNIGHQGIYAGGLTIIGDAANIQIGYLNGASILNLKLGANGISTIGNPGTTWTTFTAVKINVDGSAYTGGTTNLLLLESSNLSAISTNAVNVTGFTEGRTAVVTQDMVTDTITMQITLPAGYIGWAIGYGLSEVPSTVDVDSDGLINLMEYALGGNPTVDDAAAVSPVSFTAADSGTNWFYYVHNQRTDDATLIYTLGTETDLVNASAWNTNDVVVVGESAPVDNYKSVTNRTSTSVGAKFLKLTVEQP